eukprot:m.247749 g.247749  ORF g.247749 m.247749 type:complete len:112 (+) comp53239_c0_seq1:330-665(+)
MAAANSENPNTNTSTNASGTTERGIFDSVMPPAYGQQPQGYPPQGYPQGYPPQGYPPQGYPQPHYAHGPHPGPYPVQTTTQPAKQGGFFSGVLAALAVCCLCDACCPGGFI